MLRPDFAFVVLGGRLRRCGAWGSSASAFAAHRVQAATTASSMIAGSEPTLEGVYEVLATNPFMQDTSTAMGVELGMDADLASSLRGWSRGLAPPNRYEELLEQAAHTTDGVSSLLADVARLARAHPVDAGRRSPLVDVAASVAAPMLVGFVAWALQTARAAGCEHVGFVSRDGQLLHAIATQLEANEPAHERLSLTYTYGGRRVWHPAGLTQDLLDGEPPPWWMGDGMPRGRGLSWSPLAMLALDPVDEPTALSGALRGIEDLPHEERSARLREVWSRAEVRDALLELGRERRSRLCRHLVESGLGRGRWAMVDVGWRGQSAVSLNRALRAEHLTEPLHLYFGLRNPDPQLTRSGDWSTFLFCRPGPDAEAGYLRGLFSFLEMVCSADHGAVRGFETTPTGMQPVVDPVDPAAAAWGIGRVQAVILDVAERVTPFVDDLAEVDLRPAVTSVLQRFFLAPDPTEVAAWGAFPFGYDPAGTRTTPWVTKWSVGDALLWALRGHRPSSFWPQASRSLLPATARWLVASRERGSAVLRRHGVRRPGRG